MNDLALGVIVAMMAAVPVSVLLLIFADVIPMPDDERRRRWVRGSAAVLAVPAFVVFGVLAWGWAGAAHLQPLCAAYASPEIRATRPTAARTLLLDVDGSSAEPAWAPFLLAPAGPVVAYEFTGNRSARATAPRDGNSGGDSQGVASTLQLEVRRVVHHANRWFRVEMDRFRLFDRASGGELALGEELWITAGRARYHCGIGSGPHPVSGSSYPANDGVARFVARALRGTDALRSGSRDSAE